MCLISQSLSLSQALSNQHQQNKGRFFWLTVFVHGLLAPEQDSIQQRALQRESCSHHGSWETAKSSWEGDKSLQVMPKVTLSFRADPASNTKPTLLFLLFSHLPKTPPSQVRLQEKSKYKPQYTPLFKSHVLRHHTIEIKPKSRELGRGYFPQIFRVSWIIQTGSTEHSKQIRCYHHHEDSTNSFRHNQLLLFSCNYL